MKVGKRRKSAIGSAFIAHTVEMRRSPAWRHLPDPARRILFRLEIEHMAHGGAENGTLPCTYADFEREGVRRASIALAIRQCAELGFVEVTRPGGRSISDVRRPSLYRVTHLVGTKRNESPTHEWRQIKNDDEATQALARAAAGRRYATQAPKRLACKNLGTQAKI